MALPSVGGLGPQAVVAQQAVAADGNRYQFFFLELFYEPHSDALPPLEQFMAVTVDLAETDGGYIAWREGLSRQRVALKDLKSLPDRLFYRSAIDAMAQAVQQAFEERGFVGVLVTPATGQIGPEGEDLRPSGSVTWRLAVRPRTEARSIVAEGQPIAPAPLEEAQGEAPQASPAAQLQEAGQSPAPPPVTEPVRPAGVLPDGRVLPLVTDGPRYFVRFLELLYLPEHEQLFPVEDVMKVPVTLARTEGGFVAWREGLEPVQVRLSELSTLPDNFLYASAIRSIAQAVVAEYNRRGLIGVAAFPAPGQVDDLGGDLRPEGAVTFRMAIRAGVAEEVRTVAVGGRIADAEKVNHPAHAGILSRSPITPARPGQAKQDLLNKQRLDSYVERLNRHPARKVDAVITSASDPGSFGIDYLVQEARPWTAYFQLSNTGTASTGEWRERFGFVHNQLTSNDDILRIDYSTAGFDDSHAVSISYEAPFFNSERLRWRIDGFYSEYTASDVGLFGERFMGESYGGGGELQLNVLQRGDFFVDLIAGASYEHVSVDNELLLTSGESPFVIPRVGLRAQQVRPESTFYASLIADANLDSLASTSDDVFNDLGRADVSSSWTRLRLDLSTSFYLEPLLRGRQAGPAEVGTLDHELKFSLRGQYVLGDDRVPAGQQFVAGGLHTVRGYRESVSAGDNGVLVSAEYRYHIPRAFQPEQVPGTLFGQPFRWAPQSVYTRPDWDLILKGFVDYARIESNNPFSFETDDELLGAGLGIEFAFKHNFNIQVDWGVALEELPGRTGRGSSQFHIMATLLY